MSIDAIVNYQLSYRYLLKRSLQKKSIQYYIYDLINNFHYEEASRFIAPCFCSSVVTIRRVC